MVVCFSCLNEMSPKQHYRLEKPIYSILFEKSWLWIFCWEIVIILVGWKNSMFSTLPWLNIWAVLADALGLGLWWGCSAGNPSTASFAASLCCLRWGIKPEWRFPQMPLGVEMPSEIPWFSPHWELVVLFDWADIAPVSRAASEDRGSYFFSTEGSRCFPKLGNGHLSSSWETLLPGYTLTRFSAFLITKTDPLQEICGRETLASHLVAAVWQKDKESGS